MLLLRLPRLLLVVRGTDGHLPACDRREPGAPSCSCASGCPVAELNLAESARDIERAMRRPPSHQSTARTP